MTPGAKMNADKTLAALRPEALDGLAEDGYARRREADLARTVTCARQARTRDRRRPALLMAGMAAAAVVAAGGGIALTGGDDEPGARPPVAGERLDARSILLASAQSAEKAPVANGRWWYTRVRTIERTDRLPFKRTTRRAGSGKQLPVAATVAHSQDSWIARDTRDPARTVAGIDFKITFDSAAEKARWKAMGSPQLGGAPAKPVVNDYDEPIRFTIGNKQLTVAQFLRLPTTEKGLEAELRRRYEADVNDRKYPLQATFAEYVWGTAQDLLAGPITSGTKAALYRVLSEQPGITLAGKVTDPLGRAGVALDVKARNQTFADYRLIIATKTGQLLAYQALGAKGPLLTMAYQSMGWTNRLGERA